MPVRVGRVWDVEVQSSPSAAIGSVVLWGVLALAASRLLGLPRRAALVGSLAAVLGHWASAVGHHLGHAAAARQTGYPMTGIGLRELLGTSLYPPDEPPLAARIHRRRALGGPIASLLLAGASSGAALALRRRPGLARILARFLFFDNAFFALGSLLPLGFIDGSTLLRLRGEE